MLISWKRELGNNARRSVDERKPGCLVMNSTSSGQTATNDSSLSGRMLNMLTAVTGPARLSSEVMPTPSKTVGSEHSARIGGGFQPGGEAFFLWVGGGGIPVALLSPPGAAAIGQRPVLGKPPPAAP